MRTWTFSQAFFLLLFILSVLEGCKSNYSSESFIVIAVDRLGSDSIDCSKEPKNPNLPSSFEVLCRDFSRWSHVYTPSTLTVPALTSMMTGEYPFSHGVRNNGSNYLSANFETVAERAFRKGWSTLFISGGAPVLRKTGLGQGFEVFDDSIKPNLEIIHRPLQQTVPIFFSHLKEIGKQPLMA